ncbi:MAG: SDR family oxidoreductase [Pseudomonadota bacterium]
MGRQTALVTGVSRGIGAAIATRLNAQGYDVVGISRSTPDGFAGTHYAVDLGASDAKARLADIAAEHKPGRLVANAGIAGAADLLATTDADFEQVQRVNVQSVIWAMQACAPHMTADAFGRIVVVGSRAALGKKERISYATSKAALEGLVRTAALELGPDGVTVNIVAPGPIETEMFATLQPEGSPARKRITDATAVLRMGRPAEVADACGYFLGDDAGFTTGQTLFVCGGMSVGTAR